MAKFLNKKEQVYDLQLTSYAKYLMSIGKFKPAYYAFYDDNVIYDKKYAHSTANEPQSDVDSRIKDDTQYIESLVLFRDVEETLRSNSDSTVDYYDLQEVPYNSTIPAPDVFRFDKALGDAFLNGGSQVAPAWKAVALKAMIESSETSDTTNNTLVPQVNVVANYSLKVKNASTTFDPEGVQNFNISTPSFIDNKVISLIPQDALFYVDELNTEMLNENFELEVFHLLTSSNSDSREQIQRKYFKNIITNVQNGFMTSETPEILPISQLTTSSVEYYFDVLVDKNVDRRLACLAAEKFNKESYYIDLDFDCNVDQAEPVFYDIYGSEIGVPEICEPEDDVCQDL